MATFKIRTSRGGKGPKIGNRRCVGTSAARGNLPSAGRPAAQEKAPRRAGKRRRVRAPRRSRQSASPCIRKPALDSRLWRKRSASRPNARAPRPKSSRAAVAPIWASATRRPIPASRASHEPQRQPKAMADSPDRRGQKSEPGKPPLTKAGVRWAFVAASHRRIGTGSGIELHGVPTSLRALPWWKECDPSGADRSPGRPERARDALETGLDDMVVVDAVECLDMQRDPGVLGESLEELAHQFGVEFAELRCGISVRNTRKGRPETSMATRVRVSSIGR